MQLNRLLTRQWRNRGTTRVSATTGSALASSGPALGSPNLSMMNPAFADDLDPSAQCPMKSGRPERCDPFPFLSRQGAEPPSLNLPVNRIEVAPDLNRPRGAIGVPQYPAMRRGKTWVQDRELEKPAWTQYPVRLSHRTSLVGHIHHRHEGRHEIECVVSEGQRQRIGD